MRTKVKVELEYNETKILRFLSIKDHQKPPLC